MASLTPDEKQIRRFVYTFFLEYERPPTYQETAQQYNFADDTARLHYRALHSKHAFFLNPGTDDIRIANPLSALETTYITHVQGHRYYANCGWDMLGLSEARIEVHCTDCNQLTSITLQDDTVLGQGIVHFLVPAREWYEDLIYT